MSSSNKPASDRRKGPPLRLLCLHDAGSSAEFLQSKLQKLGDRLWANHHVELVYVNAPLVTDEGKSRAWWEATDEHPYLGLDASFLLIKHMWMSYASFSGILGVGQGAALASLLTLWLFEGGDAETSINISSRAPPQMAIFIDGFTVLPEDIPLLSIQRLECLHVLPGGYVPNDINAANEAARFVTQMGGRTHIRQVAEAWHSTDSLNCIGRYVVQQKLAHQSTQLAVVQQALVATEQQAAQLVQQHAMQSPPPSLMAIIGPSAQMSGWSGPKRDLPAGGAPCPADFVLPVHKRNGAENDENKPRLA